jgi:L-fucose isomerase-like protein
MKLDLTQFNWQHTVMMVAGFIGAGATGIMSKAADTCATASNVASCISSTQSVCTAVIAVTGAIVLAFGGASPSLLSKQPPPKDVS